MDYYGLNNNIIIEWLQVDIQIQASMQLFIFFIHYTVIS